MTVLTLTQPELFRFSDAGMVTIADGDEEGVSRFELGRDGRTRITIGLDAGRSTAIVDWDNRRIGSRIGEGNLP